MTVRQMLYLLGLSYEAVSLVLEALGVYLCKSRVAAGALAHQSWLPAAC